MRGERLARPAGQVAARRFGGQLVGGHRNLVVGTGSDARPWCGFDQERFTETSWHGDGIEERIALMKSPVSDNFEFPVQASVVPWLRACARRNGIAFEPVGQ